MAGTTVEFASVLRRDRARKRARPKAPSRTRANRGRGSFSMAFVAYRKTVYEQTVPEKQNFGTMARFNLVMQQMYVSSSFYNNINERIAYIYNPYITSGAAGIAQRFKIQWGVEGAQLVQRAQGYYAGYEHGHGESRTVTGNL
ncbi:hypothetical protein BDV23DRAFT_180307 [Aspergillus alliaceus]|uniref:Uncharacterized protein n=1 Tax=Petromyces alliaceus TaxID=209559 RepID=A0A5N7CJ15_PETAA|nr:hypothetical protein BDV23DRAFT_180307 [Aspergillus alliaceus]